MTEINLKVTLPSPASLSKTAQESPEHDAKKQKITLRISSNADKQEAKQEADHEDVQTEEVLLDVKVAPISTLSLELRASLALIISQ